MLEVGFVPDAVVRAVATGSWPGAVQRAWVGKTSRACNDRDECMNNAIAICRAADTPVDMNDP